MDLLNANAVKKEKDQKEEELKEKILKLQNEEQKLISDLNIIRSESKAESVLINNNLKTLREKARIEGLRLSAGLLKEVEDLEERKRKVMEPIDVIKQETEELNIQAKQDQKRIDSKYQKLEKDQIDQEVRNIELDERQKKIRKIEDIEREEKVIENANRSIDFKRKNLNQQSQELKEKSSELDKKEKHLEERELKLKAFALSKEKLVKEEIQKARQYYEDAKNLSK